MSNYGYDAVFNNMKTTRMVLGGGQITNSTRVNVDLGIIQTEINDLNSNLSALAANLTIGLAANVIILEAEVADINNNELPAKASNTYVNSQLALISGNLTNIYSNLSIINANVAITNNNVANVNANVVIVNSNVANLNANFLSYQSMTNSTLSSIATTLTTHTNQIANINANVIVNQNNIANLQANVANINANGIIWTANFNTGLSKWIYEPTKSGDVQISAGFIDTNTIYASNYYTKGTDLAEFLDAAGDLIMEISKSTISGSKYLQKLRLGAYAAGALGGLVVASVVASAVGDLADIFTDVSPEQDNVLQLASTVQGVLGFSTYQKFDTITSSPSVWNFALHDEMHSYEIYSLKLKNYANTTVWNSTANEKLTILSAPIAVSMNNRISSIGNVLYYNGSAISPIQTNSINVEGTSVHSVNNSFVIYTNNVNTTGLQLMTDNDGSGWSQHTATINKNYGGNLAISSELNRTDLEISNTGDTRLYGNCQFNKALQIASFVPDVVAGNLYNFGGLLYWGNTNLAETITDYFPKSQLTGLSNSDLAFGANYAIRFDNRLTQPSDTYNYMYVKANVLYFGNTSISSFTGNYFPRNPANDTNSANLRVASGYNIYLTNKVANDSTGTDGMLENVDNGLVFNGSAITTGISYLSAQAPLWTSNIANLQSEVVAIEANVLALQANVGYSYNDLRVNGNIVAGQLTAPSSNLTGRIISYNNKASPIFDQYIGNTLTAGNVATLMDYRLISADTVSKYKLALDYFGVANEYVKYEKNIVSMDYSNNSIYSLTTAGNTTYETIQPPGNDYTFCEMGCGEMGGLQKSYLVLQYGNVSNNYKYQVDLLSGYLQHQFNATGGDTTYQTNGTFTFQNTSAQNRVKINSTSLYVDNGSINTSTNIPLYIGQNGGNRIILNNDTSITMNDRMTFNPQTSNGFYLYNYLVGGIIDKTISGNYTFFSFRESGTECGSIYLAAPNVTAYATSSDYRLKENIIDLDLSESKNRIKNTRVRHFIWKNSQTGMRGVIAHEFYEDGFEQAVVGQKDAMENYKDPLTGEETIRPAYQKVDVSLAIPDLIATCKWLIQKEELIEQQLNMAVSNNNYIYSQSGTGQLITTYKSKAFKRQFGTGQLNIIMRTNEIIEIGDYLTTFYNGYGIKQDDDLRHNYTYARCLNNTSWADLTSTTTIDGIQYRITTVNVEYL